MENSATPKVSALKKTYSNGEQTEYTTDIGKNTEMKLIRDYDGSYFARLETAHFGTVQLHNGRWNVKLSEAKQKAVEAFEQYKKNGKYGRNLRMDY